jgi:hypothetical protein
MKNLQALRVLAASVFLASPTIESVEAFVDGNVFDSKKKNAIDFHKRTALKGKGEMKSHTIERDEVEELIEEKAAELKARSAKAQKDAGKTDPPPAKDTKNKTAKKDPWKGTTIPKIELVLGDKEIDFSSAEKKADLVKICEDNSLTPEAIEEAAAALKAAAEAGAGDGEGGKAGAGAGAGEGEGEGEGAGE